ncbi:MAG: archease [candidate division WOR-3 bacterium]
MLKYKYIEHTADLGIRVYGRNRTDLFKNAAHAVFETMLTINRTEHLARITQFFNLKGDSLAELLVEWLRELLFQFYTKQIVPEEFRIKFRGTRQLQAQVKFVKLERNNFRVKMEIKNVTYHNLKIRSTTKGYRTTIIFDV